MSISNITRQQFVHTITVPWAEPFEVFTVPKSTFSRAPWDLAGDNMRAAGNCALTAVVRLATPAITGFGLGKHWVDQYPNLALGAPVAAAGGAAVGAVVGTTGIVINLAEVAFYTVCSAGLVTEAGLENWRRPEPPRPVR